MNNEIINIIEEKLFVSSFLSPDETKRFNTIIDTYVKKIRLTKEALSIYLDNINKFYEIVGINQVNKLHSIMKWPSIIHANPMELLNKYMIMGYMDNTLEYSERDNILINHPKDLITSTSLLYARIMYFKTEEDTNTRNDSLSRKKIIKTTNNEFETSYNITKEALINKYPFNEIAKNNVYSLDSNKEIINKLNEEILNK